MIPRNFEEELHNIEDLMADVVLDDGRLHELVDLQNQHSRLMKEWQSSIGL